MTPRYEDTTAEQLWQTIEDLKRAPQVPARNGERSLTSPDTEMEGLLPLAESLATIFEEESQASSGQTNARLRLQNAIQADLAARPVPTVKARSRWSRFTMPQRLAFAVILLLLAAVALAASVWTMSRGITFDDGVAPNAAPGDEKCLTPSVTNPRAAGASTPTTMGPMQLQPTPCDGKVDPQK